MGVRLRRRVFWLTGERPLLRTCQRISRVDRGRLQGAGHLAPYLEKKYGTNGFALLLDEGGEKMPPTKGSRF